MLHSFRPRARDAEAEANRFASAFLMPRDRAKEDLSARMTLTDYARMKAIWGVSIQALIMRGAAVGKIDDTRKRSLYVQLSQRNWRKKEPVEVGQETPLLLWTLLERKYGPRPYVPGAEHLAIPPAVLRSIAPSPETSVRQPPPKVEGQRPTGESGTVVQFKRRSPGTASPSRAVR